MQLYGKPGKLILIYTNIFNHRYKIKVLTKTPNAIAVFLSLLPTLSVYHIPKAQFRVSLHLRRMERWQNL